MRAIGMLPVVVYVPVGLLFGIQLVLCVIGAAPSPYVAWSFDKYNGTELISDFNDEARFQSDLTQLNEDPSQAFVTGVVGDAIRLRKSQTFNLVSDIFETDCVRNPDACGYGLTIAFWLKLESWNGNDLQVILMTTSLTKSLPGIYFGKGEGEHLYFWLRRSTGPTVEVQFSHKPVWKRWAHIGLAWNKSDGSLSVYINGSALSLDVTRGSTRPIQPTKTAFAIGSSFGPAFLLDEFKVFYSVLSKEEIYEIHSQKYVSETSRAPCTGISNRPLTAYFTMLAERTEACDSATIRPEVATGKEELPLLTYVYAITISVPIVLVLLGIALLLFCCCCRREVVDAEPPKRRQTPAQYVRMFSIQGYKRTTILEPDEMAFAAVPSEESNGDFDGRSTVH